MADWLAEHGLNRKAMDTLARNAAQHQECLERVKGKGEGAGRGRCIARARAGPQLVTLAAHDAATRLPALHLALPPTNKTAVEGVVEELVEAVEARAALGGTAGAAAASGGGGTSSAAPQRSGFGQDASSAEPEVKPEAQLPDSSQPHKEKADVSSGAAPANGHLHQAAAANGTAQQPTAALHAAAAAAQSLSGGAANGHAYSMLGRKRSFGEMSQGSGGGDSGCVVAGMPAAQLVDAWCRIYWAEEGIWCAPASVHPVLRWPCCAALCC